MIIVEGMDNTGKTTLIKHLTDKFELESDNRNRPKDINDGFKMIRRSMFSQTPKIYDRHVIISELIYGPVLRNKSMFGNFNWDLLFLLLKSHPLIIHCRPPRKDILKFGDREQMDGVIRRADVLLNRYDWVFNIMRESVSVRSMYNMRYDYTDKMSLKAVENRVNNYLKYNWDESHDVKFLDVDDNFNLEDEENRESKYKI